MKKQVELLIAVTDDPDHHNTENVQDRDHDRETRNVTKEIGIAENVHLIILIGETNARNVIN